MFCDRKRSRGLPGDSVEVAAACGGILQRLKQSVTCRGAAAENGTRLAGPRVGSSRGQPGLSMAGGGDSETEARLLKHSRLRKQSCASSNSRVQTLRPFFYMASRVRRTSLAFAASRQIIVHHHIAFGLVLLVACSSTTPLFNHVELVFPWTDTALRRPTRPTWSTKID